MSLETIEFGDLAILLVLLIFEFAFCWEAKMFPGSKDNLLSPVKKLQHAEDTSAMFLDFFEDTYNGGKFCSAFA